LSTLCTSTYIYVYSFLGRAWGIDWLTSQRSMKYTCVIQFKLYLPTYARSQIPTYKLCLIVIRSKYATHIHHVFKNCLKCDQEKNIRTCRSTQCWQLSIMLHVDLLVQEKRRVYFMYFCTHENINLFISTDRSSFPNNKI
jgi:hypothetical protein